MALENIIQKMKTKILPILKKYQVKKASFFGSITQGNFKKDSDIDILVELSNESSLFDFIGLKNELEDTVERKIDLVEYDTIKKPIREKILAGQVHIL
jgi:hypothetical protein